VERAPRHVPIRLNRSRVAAVLLLLLTCLGAAEARAAERLRIAAERGDGRCSADPKILVLVRLEAAPPPEAATGCVFLVRLASLEDVRIDEVADRLSALRSAAGAALEFPAGSDPARVSYAVKRLSSIFRAGSPDAPVALDIPDAIEDSLEEELAPYLDALVDRGDRAPAPLQVIAGRWVLSAFDRPEGSTAASNLIRAIAREQSAGASLSLAGLLQNRAADLRFDAQDAAFVRLQAYLQENVSRDPNPAKVTLWSRSPSAPSGWDVSPLEPARFFEAKNLTPILFLPASSSPRVEIEVLPGAYSGASVENLDTSARREFPLGTAKVLVLDPSHGALAVVLHPARRPEGETRAAVEVGAARGLTAEEIVARERVWDAGQRERVSSYIADVRTSLRFRIEEVNETFDLTILGPLFYRRGEPPDWKWEEFYLNGVKWKGRQLPKLPILQPEKVTSLPLDLRLTEEYDYSLRGEATVSGRRAYHIAFAPKKSFEKSAIYRGSVWIDKELFALLRRDTVQLNLKGETLSNVQTELYRPVAGHPDVLLPLEIRGEQVFSTAGRTTGIERDVVMREVLLNSPDFDDRRAAAYASSSQMIRDTEKGMRYLLPDPQHPGGRVVEEHVSRRSTFGLLGAFYDGSLDYPLPLAGIQYFDFDLWGKGKQLSVFFAGALLSANYTDPSLGGSHFDLGADLFAVAVPFGDTSYRDGKEVPSEKIKHLPAVFQVNLGHPIGPYLKASLGLFTKWDNYQRDSDTGPNFVTPVDTFTDGVELRLVGNYSGFNAVASGSLFRRRKWEFWGDPATSEFNPDQQHYRKYSLSLSKDQYFSGFRKLHIGVSWLGGSDLDRFSKYEFGTFSGNPIRGYKSGSLRTENAVVANLSYGLNIENIIRFEGFYDQAILNDKQSGFDNAYFSGAGFLASLNGPWSNSIIRGEIGTPVVSHGVHGVVINVILLKLF
jgi:hypothetical protein